MERLFMPNKSLAKEWLIKAYHDLSSAQVLYDAEHFTDTIGYDLQQAIEKCLKSFLAYENKQVKKIHDLIDVYGLVNKHITLDELEIRFLATATNYYTHNRYPAIHCFLPERKEIKEVLDFATDLFEKVCQILEISKTDIEEEKI